MLSHPSEEMQLVFSNPAQHLCPATKYLDKNREPTSNKLRGFLGSILIPCIQWEIQGHIHDSYRSENMSFVVIEAHPELRG